MKTKIFITVFILGLCACTDKNQSLVSQNEKEKIANEVELVLNSYFDGCRNLDVNKAFKELFFEASDFIYIGIDGSFMNYNDLYTIANQVFSTYKKAEFIIHETKIRVISRDVALASVNFTDAFYSPEAKETYPNCGSTFVLNKIDDEWKIIHFHESFQESKFFKTEID